MKVQPMVIFCKKDKDNAQKYKNSVKSINIKSVQILEPIFWDNSVNNIGQFQARQNLIETYQGSADYIWFLDGDDALPKVESDDTPQEADIVEFNYYEYKNGTRNSDKPVVYTGIPFRKTMSCWDREAGDIVNPVLWNKWIKVEILKNIKIPDYLKDKHPTNNEDYYLVLKSMELAKSVFCSKLFMYIYNVDNSLSHKLKFGTYSLEELDRLLKDMEYINRATREIGEPNLLIMYFKNSSEYLLRIALACDNIKGALDRFYQIFGKDELVKILLNSLGMDYSHEPIRTKVFLNHIIKEHL